MISLVLGATAAYLGVCLVVLGLCHDAARGDLVVFDEVDRPET